MRRSKKFIRKLSNEKRRWVEGKMMEGKTCPIFRATKDREDTKKCLKEDCAWWDMHYNCCAILSFAILLEVLAKREKAQSKTYEEKVD